jgi:hypothetical protein
LRFMDSLGDGLGGAPSVDSNVVLSHVRSRLRARARRAEDIRGYGWKRLFAFSSVLCVMAVCLLLTGSRTAWLGASVGVGVTLFGSVRSWRRVAVLTFVLGSVIMSTMLLAPQSTIFRIHSTFGPEDVGGRARLWFWDGTLGMIRANPLLGVGPGNYAYWSPYYLGEALHTPGGERRYHNTIHTLHAHCEPMELLAETGIPGVVCALWMLARLLRRRGPEWAPLAAFGVFSLFNPALHSAPHALAAVLLAAGLMARGRLLGEERRDGWARGKWASGLMPVPAIALGFFTLYCVVGPSWQLRKAEQLHLSGQPSFTAYAETLAHPWPNAAAHEKYGIGLFQAGRYAEARKQLEQALDGLDTGGIYLLLGIIAAKELDSATAQERLEQCLYRWPSNDEAWRQLLRVSRPEERAELMERARPWLTDDAFLGLVRGVCAL